MKNLLKRSLTGVLYVVIIVATVLISPLTLYLLSAVLTALAILEFERLKAVPVKSRAVKTIDIFGGLLLVSIFAAIAHSPLTGVFLVPLYLLYIVVRLVVELYRGDALPITSLGHSMLGQLYIALPLGLLNILPLNGGKAIVLAMFIMIWLNDTGAFCVGSLAGRHKLFERISPKKTWEGFAGGLIFTIVSAFIFKYCFGGYYPQSAAILATMGLVVSVTGTWGDLVESMMKRAVHVKDSGNLLPGHGGILDRIDSLLLVIPALTLFFYIPMLVEFFN